MLDCTLNFRIKTLKTAFPWLKMHNTFDCNRQGTEKTVEERTLSSSSIHVRTSLQQNTQTQLAVSAELVPVKRNRTVSSDKTCEKLITREVLCFPVSKLDALNSILDALGSSLDPRSFWVSRIEDRVSSFEGLSTYICMVLYMYNV